MGGTGRCNHGDRNLREHMNAYGKAAEVIDWLISEGAKPEFFRGGEWEWEFVDLITKALRKSPHEEVIEQLELFKYNVQDVARHRDCTRQAIYWHINKARKNVKAAA